MQMTNMLTINLIILLINLTSILAGVRVEMLLNDWMHTEPSMVHHLRSLINFSHALPHHRRGAADGGNCGSIVVVIFHF